MQVLETLSQFVGDEPHHIFSKIHPIESPIEKVFCHTCIPNDNNQTLPTPLQLLKCGGAGLTSEESEISAVGEGLERYAAVKYSLEATTISASENSLVMSDNEASQFPVVSSDQWLKYTANQFLQPGFPLQPLDKGSIIKWYKARRLSDDAEHLVPGPLSVFAYRRAKEEERHYPTTSTGLALGLSRPQAILSGLLEVIERDAIALAWTYRRPVSQVGDTCIMFQNVKAELGLAEDLTVQVFDISTESSASVFMAFIEFKVDGKEYLCVGSAARLSARPAMRKALLEAAQGIPYVQWLREKFQSVIHNRFSDVDSFEKSAVFYSLYPSHKQNIKERWGNFLNVRDTVTLGSQETKLNIDESLEHLQAELAMHGHVVYYIDCAEEKLTKKSVFVTKVLVPSMYSLEGNYRLRILNDERANMLALAEGVEYEYCEFPHPLP
jgi:thiazole/oxazole-forming peptide maturase SagD family component